MALPPEILKELLATFRVDVDDQLQSLSDALLAMEKEADGTAQGELLHNAMRAAHNIKGAARGIGVTNVGEVSHSLENLLTALMKRPDAFSAEIGDLCFEGIDAIRQALQAYTDETDLPFDKKDLTARLDRGLDDAPVSAAVPKKERPAPEPEPEPEPDPEPEPEPTVAAPDVQNKATVVDKPTAEQKGGEILRIPSAKLDRLEALVEETHAAKIDMDDFIELLRKLQVSTQSASGGAAADGEGCTDMGRQLESVQKMLRSRARTMGVVLTSIRYEMRTLRLLPAAGLTRPLARSVRDIARQMGKKVVFETVGEDTEMDRAVMDMLTDPLVHLLRNAIDHGVESPADRVAAGKPESGTIRVTFRLDGGQVRIILEDDGAGINADKVRDAAVAKKVISREDAAAMSREKVLDLIFHPGFSTKQIITDVSGRGVGMDIVRSNIRALSGDIAVDTREGAGSTFTLSVPLTLATERGLIVSASGQTFALPATNVDRVVDARRDDLIDVEGSKAIMVDGQPVALRQLSQVLGIDSGLTALPDSFPVVVVSAGWRRVALLVDEAHGQREMVVRPLAAPLVNVRNVAGGTLVSGRVRIVLSARTLVEDALGTASAFTGDGDGEGTVAKTILAVDDSLTTRTLMKNVLEGAGYDVTSSINGEEAWKVLQEQTFDLIVSDVEMPLMDGFELTQKIKDSDRHGQTPVIIVTSLTKEEDRQRGIEVGADAYIVKGEFESHVLLDVVTQLI